CRFRRLGLRRLRLLLGAVLRGRFRLLRRRRFGRGFLLGLLGRRLRLLFGLACFFVFLRHGLLPRLGAGVAAAQDLAHLAAAAGRHRARAHRARQRVEGGLDHVVGVGGADRLRHHVLHTQRLEDGPHRAAGDDAGALWRGAYDHRAGAVMAAHIVMERAPFTQGDAHHGAARLLGRLADRLRHLARLARAVADAALAVAHHDDGGKAEAAAALHHLGDAIDADKLFDELAVLALTIAPVAALAAAPAGRTIATAFAGTSAAASPAGGPVASSWCTCHAGPSSEIEAALAGGVGQRLHAAVEEIAAAIEDD